MDAPTSDGLHQLTDSNVVQAAVLLRLIRMSLPVLPQGSRTGDCLHTLVRPPATRRCRYTSRASSFTFRHRLEKRGSLLFTFRRSQL